MDSGWVAWNEGMRKSSLSEEVWKREEILVTDQAEQSLEGRKRRKYGKREKAVGRTVAEERVWEEEESVSLFFAATAFMLNVSNPPVSHPCLDFLFPTFNFPSFTPLYNDLLCHSGSPVTVILWIGLWLSRTSFLHSLSPDTVCRTVSISEVEAPSLILGVCFHSFTQHVQGWHTLRCCL